METKMQNKIDIVSKIEEIIADISPNFMTSNGYIRLNSCDIGLDIRAGTIYLDLKNEAIICIGNSKNLDYYGGFEYVAEEFTMSIKMGNQSVKIYLSEDDRVQSCLNHYFNVYLPDLEQQEELARN